MATAEEPNIRPPILSICVHLRHSEREWRGIEGLVWELRCSAWAPPSVQTLACSLTVAFKVSIIGKRIKQVVSLSLSRCTDAAVGHVWASKDSVLEGINSQAKREEEIVTECD